MLRLGLNCSSVTENGYSRQIAEKLLVRLSTCKQITALRPAQEFFTSAVERLQSVGLYAWRSGPIGFEQGGVFIVPHLLFSIAKTCGGLSVFPVSSKGPSAGPPLSKIPGSAYVHVPFSPKNV